MAHAHCRYCDGEFNSIEAHDDHLLIYDDMEGRLMRGSDGQMHRPGSVTSMKGFNGRPVCKGQRQGSPFTDPMVAVAVEKGRRLAAFRRT